MWGMTVPTVATPGAILMAMDPCGGPGKVPINPINSGRLPRSAWGAICRFLTYLGHHKCLRTGLWFKTTNLSIGICASLGQPEDSQTLRQKLTNAYGVLP